jgi:hypothetical protein
MSLCCRSSGRQPSHRTPPQRLLDSSWSSRRVQRSRGTTPMSWRLCNGSRQKGGRHSISFGSSGEATEWSGSSRAASRIGSQRRREQVGASSPSRSLAGVTAFGHGLPTWEVRQRRRQLESSEWSHRDSNQGPLACEADDGRDSDHSFPSRPVTSGASSWSGGAGMGRGGILVRCTHGTHLHRLPRGTRRPPRLATISRDPGAKGDATREPSIAARSGPCAPDRWQSPSCRA